MDELLVRFAHAIAPGPTRAVVNGTSGSLVVFVEDGPVEDGTAVVAKLPSPARSRFVTGTATHPAPGWVQIGSTVYPEHRVTVRGPVLFVARPVREEDLKRGKRRTATGSRR